MRTGKWEAAEERVGRELVAAVGTNIDSSACRVN
jgi:hypothetical protein